MLHSKGPHTQSCPVAQHKTTHTELSCCTTQDHAHKVVMLHSTRPHTQSCHVAQHKTTHTHSHIRRCRNDLQDSPSIWVVVGPAGVVVVVVVVTLTRCLLPTLTLCRRILRCRSLSLLLILRVGAAVSSVTREAVVVVCRLGALVCDRTTPTTITSRII